MFRENETLVNLVSFAAFECVPTSTTMSDVPIEHDEPSAGRKRNRRLAIVATVAIIVVVLLELLNTEQQTTRTLKPGELITESGTYRCGSRVVTVSEREDGFIAITSAWMQEKFIVLDGLVDNWPHHPELIEDHRDWFACVDELDRVWIYVGPTDRSWRERGPTPGGGIRPRTPSVTLQGVYFWQNDVHRGVASASGNGLWDGVPHEFFERIPHKDEPIWGQVPPIPDSPQPLSPAARIQIVNYLQMLQRNMRLSDGGI